MNVQTEEGVEVPIESVLVATRRCREIEIFFDGEWRRLTGWSTYRGEAHLHIGSDVPHLRGEMRVDTVRARSSTLLCHGDHWCTTRGDWA